MSVHIIKSPTARISCIKAQDLSTLLIIGNWNTYTIQSFYINLLAFHSSQFHFASSDWDLCTRPCSNLISIRSRRLALQRVSAVNYYSFERSMIHQWPQFQHMSVFLLSLLEDNDIYIRITPQVNRDILENPLIIYKLEFLFKLVTGCYQIHSMTKMVAILRHFKLNKNLLCPCLHQGWEDDNFSWLTV